MNIIRELCSIIGRRYNRLHLLIEHNDNFIFNAFSPSRIEDIILILLSIVSIQERYPLHKPYVYTHGLSIVYYLRL